MDIHPIHLIMSTTIRNLDVNARPLHQADVHPGIQTEVLLHQVVHLKNQLLSCTKMVKHQLNMNKLKIKHTKKASRNLGAFSYTFHA